MGLFRRKARSEAEKALPEVAIHDAVARGLIEFDLVGVGEGVTSRVNLRVTKRTDDAFILVVPSGTEFVPVTVWESEAG